MDFRIVKNQLIIIHSERFHGSFKFFVPLLPCHKRILFNIVINHIPGEAEGWYENRNCPGYQWFELEFVGVVIHEEYD
jgi:hypothetical protein